MTPATRRATAQALKQPRIQTVLAGALDINQSAVSRWLARGRIPADRVAAVEKYTGVPRWKLRPDIFVRPAKRRGR